MCITLPRDCHKQALEWCEVLESIKFDITFPNCSLYSYPYSLRKPSSSFTRARAFRAEYELHPYVRVLCCRYAQRSHSCRTAAIENIFQYQTRLPDVYTFYWSVSFYSYLITQQPVNKSILVLNNPPTVSLLLSDIWVSYYVRERLLRHFQPSSTKPLITRHTAPVAWCTCRRKRRNWISSKNIASKFGVGIQRYTCYKRGCRRKINVLLPVGTKTEREDPEWQHVNKGQQAAK